MKILYLGPKSKILEFLQHSNNVTQTEDTIEATTISSYDWVISYGYRHILKKQHIESSKNPIINLHISFLPYNRGADPNYWSWVDNTPKGVTIHAIDEGIDTGDIFIQKEVTFSENETLSSSYNKLKKEIEKLFINNFKNIIKSNILPHTQPAGGSLHYVKDFPGVDSWDIKIEDLKMTDLKIIDAVESVRNKNNKNWMDILRLAFKYAPEEARPVLAEINRSDGKISKLLDKLANNG
jgi:folate-dependent phosphoribosylglycinamide formyltransferase PurN